MRAAQDIAKEYPLRLKEEYVREAETLRLPYWDWLKDAQLPEVVMKETITVLGPEGLREIINPLFTYKFQAGSSVPANFTTANVVGCTRI